MPTYIHNGTTWVEVASTSTSVTTGGNIYVRTSGSGSLGQTRILGIDIHDGTTWRSAYTAYVVAAPAKPATPTLTRTTTTWNSRVDQTSVSWTGITGATGYQLDFLDANYSVLNTFFYESTVRSSGAIAISPGGNAYYFRLYAFASNEAGTTYSDPSSLLRVISGNTNSPFSVNRPSNYTFSSYPFTWSFASTANATDCAVGNSYSVSKSGSSADPMVPGYCVTTNVSYEITDNGIVSIAGSDRYVRELGTGLVGFDYSVGNGYGVFTNPRVTTRSYNLNVAGSVSYSLTALGGQWSSRQTGCTAGNASAKASNLTISGYETTANQP